MNYFWLKCSDHGNVTIKTLYPGLLRDNIVIMGPIERPLMVKEVDSVVWESKFSGISSDNSINLLVKICETSLAGQVSDPGPR